MGVENTDLLPVTCNILMILFIFAKYGGDFINLTDFYE